MKQEEVIYRSSLELRSIRQAVRAALTGKIDLTPMQFDALDDPPEFAVLVEKRMFASNAAVQFCIDDHGESRTVRFVALGDGGFNTALQMATTSGFNKGNVKLGKSRQLVEEMLSALRREDPSLQKIN